MSRLLLIDQSLFSFLNQEFTHPALDVIMMGITFLGENFWIFVPIWLFFVIRSEKRTRPILLLLIPLLLLSDALCSWVLKPAFSRPRPYFEMEGVHLLLTAYDHLSQYGFPSNHATNIFALGTFLTLCYPKPAWQWGLFFLAILVCWSRIYMGVHYPLDVLVGGLIGSTLGSLLFIFYSKFKASQKQKS